MDDNEITISLTLTGSDQHLLLALRKLNARENNLGVSTRLMVTHIRRSTSHLEMRTLRYISVDAFLHNQEFLATVDRPEIVGRVVHRLNRAGILTVNDLLKRSPSGLLQIYDFGPSALDFVLARLEMDGLKLKSV